MMFLYFLSHSYGFPICSHLFPLFFPKNPGLPEGPGGLRPADALRGGTLHGGPGGGPQRRQIAVGPGLGTLGPLMNYFGLLMMVDDH